MSAVQYATAEQYFEFRGIAMPNDFSDADRMLLDANLKRASTSVKRATRLALVSYRNDGIPKNGTIAQGFADATSATVVWWGGPGGDATSEGASGTSSQYDSIAMDGVSYSRSTSAAAAAQSTAAEDRVSPEAMEILSTLPIWSTSVRTIR